MVHETSSENRRPRKIYFPVSTDDYYVGKGKTGLGLFANRDIAKGETVFENSIEFRFSHILDGDQVWFEGTSTTTDRTDQEIPEFFPLTREVLLKTHGVPMIVPSNEDDSEDSSMSSSSVQISWYLEVPGMFMNHSSDPSTTSMDDNGEDVATRDIRKGEELTVDYIMSFYDTGCLIERCQCHAPTCRGHMMGFKSLCAAEQKELLNHISPAVEALYLHDIGQGPPVHHEQTICLPRQASNNLCLVYPGPSHGSENVGIFRKKPRIEDIPASSGGGGSGIRVLASESIFHAGDPVMVNDLGLKAMRSFSKGECVCCFWSFPWPKSSDSKKKIMVDYVFSSPEFEGDPDEGTVVVRMGPNKWCQGNSTIAIDYFSGYHLFAKHSERPNLVLGEDSDGKKQKDEADWYDLHATRAIQSGEELTFDFREP